MKAENIQWSPLVYKEAAVIAREAAEEMVSRLDLVTLQPGLIVDVGCGLGESCELLHKKYPQAKIIGIDHSQEMLAHAQSHSKTKAIFLNSDASALPFENQSVDLLFANFLFPWISDVATLLREWQRVLRPEGLLMFTALGPDTLAEWQDQFHSYNAINKVDMHDIGDVLLNLFSDPVLDINHYVVSFREKRTMLDELISMGLYTSQAINLLDELPPQNILEANFEVVFAHAFGKTVATSTSNSETKISVASLRQQLKSRI